MEIQYKSLEFELLQAISKFKAIKDSDLYVRKLKLINEINKKKMQIIFNNQSGKQYRLKLFYNESFEGISLLSCFNDVRSNFQFRRLNALRHLPFLLKFELESHKKINRTFENIINFWRFRNDGQSSHSLIPRSDVILLVSIHKSESPGCVNEHILFLGRQMLIELRDSISCLFKKFAVKTLGSISQIYLYLNGKLFLEFDNVQLKKNCRNLFSETYVPQVHKDHQFTFSSFMTNNLLTQSMETTRFIDLIVCIGTGAWGIICHE